VCWLPALQVTESMFHCYEVVGCQGQYSPYILEGHRPSVSIFLKDCTEEQQVHPEQNLGLESRHLESRP
jgi:hypothetical protein